MIKKNIFISNVFSYHGKELMKNIFKSNEKSKSLGRDDGKMFEIFSMHNGNEVKKKDFEVNFLDSDDFNSIIACDIIIFDVSLNIVQLSTAKQFIKIFQDFLMNSKIHAKKELILLTTIMTWAETHQINEKILGDSNFSSRRSHPCFFNHVLLERNVLNLAQLYPDLVSSIIVCPGIIYGGEQDIFHFIYKSCYFNNLEINIFEPGTNFLPLIYLKDFMRIMMMIINDFPDPNPSYILAVQPDSLTAISVVEIFAKAMNQEEIRINICTTKEEVFLMNSDLMSQRVCNHLTLNLKLHSDYLESKDFKFSMTGLNLALKSEILAEQFYESRKLKPLKILIEGSPFAHHSEIADMIGKYYSLHQIQNETFLERICKDMSRKISKAEAYIEKMTKLKCYKNEIYDEMIKNVSIQIIKWKQNHENIKNLLSHTTEPTFDELLNLIGDRLGSFDCSKHQGYVMSGFSLTSLHASKLFLDELIWNELIKPDLVIIINRELNQGDKCTEDRSSSEEIKENSAEMARLLKNYYESYDDETTIGKFFSNRGIVRIEFTIDHDLSKSELMEIFETIKNKIGKKCYYGLSIEEQENIDRFEKEKQDNILLNKNQQELQKKEEKFNEWTKKILKQKRKEIEEIEKHCLPTRHYLTKYILPYIMQGLVEVAKTRPNKPIEFLANFLLSQEIESFDEIELNENIINEFRKIVEFFDEE